MHYIHLDLRLRPCCVRGHGPSDIRALFRRSELPIVGPSGRPTTMPILDNDFIGFNGVNLFCTCDPDSPDYHGLRSCHYATCEPGRRDNDSGQPFVIDLKPDRPYGITELRGRYWIDCKTYRKPYDQAVMLAMIALKHHLDDQVEMHSKGRWNSRVESRRRALGPVGGPEAARADRHLRARVPRSRAGRKHTVQRGNGLVVSASEHAEA